MKKNDRPPLGGVVVWGGHISYISAVSEDGNTIYVQESGWSDSRPAPKFDENGNETPDVWGWRSDIKRTRRLSDYNWSYNSYEECLGFIANPAIENNAPVTTESNVYISINGKFVSSTPLIKVSNGWAIAKPMIKYNDKWVEI